VGAFYVAKGRAVAVIVDGFTEQGVTMLSSVP